MIIIMAPEGHPPMLKHCLDESKAQPIAYRCHWNQSSTVIKTSIVDYFWSFEFRRVLSSLFVL